MPLKGVDKVIPHDFTFDVDPETFRLSLNYNGIREDASAALPRMRVTDLVKQEGKVSWTITGRGISILIKKADNYLEVTIHATSKGRFVWPSASATSYTLPFGEGKYIPANDKWWQAFVKDQTFTFSEVFSMGFFALNKPKYTIIYIVQNIFNNEVRFPVDSAIGFSFIHEFTSINKEKTYGFRIYITDPDPSAVCAVYKHYIQEKGRFKSLKEKASENANVRKLYGAPHIYFWSGGLIKTSNVHWKQLQASWGSYTSLFTWFTALLNKIEGKDEGQQLSDVWQQTKKGEITAYQKRVLLRVLNSVLAMPELYSPAVFKYPIGSRSPTLLSEQQLYVLNKKLLKSALKNSIDDPALWGNTDRAVLDDMHRSGFTKAWIGFPDWADGLLNTAMVQQAVQFGYLVAPYDAYHSIEKEEDRTWRSNWFPDSSLYDHATVTDATGKKISGFLSRGRHLNPTLTLSAVKFRLESILRDHIPYNSWFVDCDAYGEVFDDYTPEHITTQEEDSKARNLRLEYIGKEKQMVVGSEGGNDYASRSIVFAQGLEMPVFDGKDPDLRSNKDSPYYLGRYWSPTGIASIYSKPVPFKPLYRHIYVDPAYSLPLFRMVYNDAIITTPHWESGSLKLRDDIGTRMLSELLYNTPPLYHLDAAEWAQQKELLSGYVTIWTQLHRNAVRFPMTGYDVLSADRMVQQTRFGDHIRVTVNFSNKKVRLGNTLLKPRSATINIGKRRLIYSVKSQFNVQFPSG